jgi:aminoglycoside phosphotransferase (APT) family kinase protein
MSELNDPNEGTTSVRPGFELDVAALIEWLSSNVEGYSGPLSVEQFKGGQSNPTYRLVTPQRSYVLRRKPPGELLKGAHAIEREARVISALHGTGYPVPRVFGLCTDDSVIGTWFYIMENVEGRIFWDATLPGMAPSERAAIYDSMNDAVARLHLVDHEGVGLADYGRAGNYFERQVARWSRQYLEDADAGRDATMDRLIEWLQANMPQDDDETRIIHGDFRIDNMIFHPSKPRVVAVLDWELSTLGHPGADFAYSAMSYRMPPHIVAGLGGHDLQGTGIPTEEEYLAAYCARTGRAKMPHYDYHIAFCFFRLAAIFHGIKGRAIRGTAASAQAQQRAAVLPELIELAWQQAMRAGV